MKKISLEKVSNYAVILIAFIALFVSIWQIKVAQNHNKLSVKPYLDYHLIQIDSALTVSISNHGFGPAVIKRISFEHNGIKYSSLEDFLKNTGEIKNRLGSYQYGKNSILPAEQTKLLVKLKGIKLRNVKVFIEYETVYEEKKSFNFSF
ncbi:hypothetical protein [uncultured Tenacibaculum sp.]|uniref:hypothetical protein n=1 Tax=uncultured Tenacibaculum sp. TaxID=174713 RepID=UPI002624CD20|nr:hypothetical protein [uncultured Tenacibaculum sp.]